MRATSFLIPALAGFLLAACQTAGPPPAPAPEQAAPGVTPSTFRMPNARTSCAAGNDARAISQVRATKSRFGYP